MRARIGDRDSVEPFDLRVTTTFRRERAGGDDRAMTFTTGTTAYARHVGRYGPRLSAAHADAAGVIRADRALDVGCGPGVLLLELAQRLGASRVAGVDPSEPFVEAARAAVPGADVRVAPAERLPFEADAFDVVLSQLVVNFMLFRFRAADRPKVAPGSHALQHRRRSLPLGPPAGPGLGTSTR
jgi:SAM-dependent methyltransferase